MPDPHWVDSGATVLNVAIAPVQYWFADRVAATVAAPVALTIRSSKTVLLSEPLGAPQLATRPRCVKPFVGAP